MLTAKTLLLGSMSLGLSMAQSHATEYSVHPNVTHSTVPHPGSGPHAPMSRANEYHSDYKRVSDAFRNLHFPVGDDTGGDGGKVDAYSHLISEKSDPDQKYKGALYITHGYNRGRKYPYLNGDGGTYEPYNDAPDSNTNSVMRVEVVNLPADGVVGCEPLESFYTEVREALTKQLQYAIDMFEQNTGDQEEIEGLRTDIENAQKDVHAIEVFCGDLANSLRIRRNIYHAYTSAWGQIKFGDGTLPRRHLRATEGEEVTHEAIVRHAMKNVDHEPEVKVGLLM